MIALGMSRVWVRRGEYIGSWWGNRRERDPWGDLGVDGWIILGCTINQLFTSAQHLLLLTLGLHVSTDHSVIFRSLISYKFQGAVHIFGIPIVFTLKLYPFISVRD